MKTLKQSLLITSLVLPFATIAACQAPTAHKPQETTVITGVVTTSENNPTSTVTASTSFPQSITVLLSSAPKVGETVDLTMSIQQNSTRASTQVNKSWLKFMWRNTEGTYHEYRNAVEVPLNEVSMGTTENWSGALSAENPLNFTIPIKLLKPGLWDITAYADVEDATGKHEVYDRIYLGTTAEKAGIRGSEADRLGQLEWMKDYHDYTGEGFGRDIYRMDTSIDFQKPPLLGAPSEVKWSVVSEYDADDIKISIYFMKWELGRYTGVEVSGSTLLKDGNLKWAGSLKKGVPVTGSAVIVFPYEGDWEIVIYCKDAKNESNPSSGIYFNVGSNGSRWGWLESHDAPGAGPLPIPEGPPRQ